MSPANLNSPDADRHRRASGSRRARCDARKRSGAKRAIMLQVSAPFHCALLKPAEERLGRNSMHVRLPICKFPL